MKRLGLKIGIVIGIAIIIILGAMNIVQFQNKMKIIQIMNNTCQQVIVIQNNSQTIDSTSCSSLIPSEGLLAKRVYAKILQPKSYLITNFYPLQKALKSYIHERDLSVSLYVENLNGGANMGIDENEGAFPASLNKIPVAVLVLQQIGRGRLELNQTIELNGTNENITVQAALEKMLKESDNNAFYSLLGLINNDIGGSTDLKRLLDYYSIDINGVYETPDSTKANDILLGPKVMANMFGTLYYSTVLSDKDSEYLLRLLANTTYGMKEQAKLPENVTLSNKYGVYQTGNIQVFNNCGIIYEFDPNIRVLYCIMTRDLNEKEARAVTAEMINSIYSYVIQTRSELDVYKKQGYI